MLTIQTRFFLPPIRQSKHAGSAALHITNALHSQGNIAGGKCVPRKDYRQINRVVSIREHAGVARLKIYGVFLRSEVIGYLISAEIVARRAVDNQCPHHPTSSRPSRPIGTHRSTCRRIASRSRSAWTVE